MYYNKLYEIYVKRNFYNAKYFNTFIFGFEFI